MNSSFEISHIFFRFQFIQKMIILHFKIDEINIFVTNNKKNINVFIKDIIKKLKTYIKKMQECQKMRITTQNSSVYS